MGKAENLSLDNYLFSDYYNYENLSQIVNNNKRVVLLSDAGIGKTTELKHIAYHYSSLYPSSFYPIFVPLNEYTNKSITEYINHRNWEIIPENILLFILDGFDEIQSKNKIDAIREIGHFAAKYPDAHIVVSCRTNFYKIEYEDNKGLLDGFTSYILLDLENKQIKNYVEEKLSFKSARFFDSINEKRLYTLLKSPFYLVHLVELYLKNNELPKNKAEIFKELLDSRIKLDVSHYYSTRDLEQEKEDITKNLEYVALVMECLGRNYIDNKELEKILPKTSSRELLNYCTTWIKKGTNKVTWQFEHNKFQEYLAAKKLADYPIEVIKELVSFGNSERIIPSWISTLSFLVSIYNLLSADPHSKVVFFTIFPHQPYYLSLNFIHVGNLSYYF